MRQGQQNRRGRGRNNKSGGGGGNPHNTNRKSQNPLTRSFESSGPDVKVRGTPAHVAEKYISLARDALSSGDPVLAESYLQHAEHYNRIILTYREQQMSQGGEYQGSLPRAQTFNAQDPMDGEDDDDEGDDAGGNTQPQVTQGHAAQGEGQPSGGGMQQPRPFDAPQRYDNRPQRHDNNRGDNRQANNNNNQRQDRNDGNRFDRNDRNDRYDRGDRNDGRNDNRNFNRNDNRNDNRGDNRTDRHFDRNGGGEPRGFRNDQGNDRGPQPSFAGEGQSGASPQGGEGYNNNGNGHRRRDRFQPNPALAGGAGGQDERPPLPPFAAQPVVAAQPPLPPVQAVPPPAAVAPLDAEQPAFLRRPVRRPRTAAADPASAPAPRAPAVDDQD